MRAIAYYTTKFSPNQFTLLDSFQKMLGDDFELHFFVPPQEYKNFEDQGLTGYKIHLFSGTKDIFSAIPKVCRQENIRVISNLINFSVHGFHTAVIAKRAGIKSVGIVGAEEMHNYKKAPQLDFKLKLFLVKRIFGGAVIANLLDTIQVLGPNLGAMMRERAFLFNKNKILVLPQPIDVNQFVVRDKKEAREKLGIPAHQDIILYVGRIAYLKGNDRLLKMIEEMPDKHFYLIGTLQSFRGEAVEGYREKLERLENAHYLGSVPHKRIPLYYSAADVLFHPSRDDGVPHTIMEAMACGTPVVATDTGDISSFSPPCVLADDSNFKEKIEYALEHRKELGRQSRKKIEDCFSIEILKARYLNFFNQAADEEFQRT